MWQGGGIVLLGSPGPLHGQFEAFARLPCKAGDLFPFVGQLITTGKGGRKGYDFDISTGHVLDPNLFCSGSFVNDFLGPDRSARARLKSTQNVEFIQLYDESNYPHIFWKALRDIPANEALLGDYGESYPWGDCGDASPRSLAFRKLISLMRGDHSSLAIDLS